MTPAVGGPRTVARDCIERKSFSREGGRLPSRASFPLWVKDGKTPIEHMFCGLPGIADIIENVGVSIALHLTEQSHSMGRPAFTSDAAHSTAGDVAAIALQYAPRPDQLLAELGLDLRRARWPAAAARSTCGPCSLCGVANTTASTAGSARSASRSFASAMRAQRKSPRR